MSDPEGNQDGFNLDEEYLAEPPAEEGSDYDRMIDRADKRVRSQPKRGRAAWSRLEEVLAERRLERDLREIFDEDL